MALSFTTGARLVASSFEADADDANDAAELADDATAVFEDPALVSDAFIFVLDVLATEAGLAVALACTAASSALVVVVKADDVALSVGSPTAVALAEAYPVLVDAALTDNAAVVSESTAAKTLCSAVVPGDLALVLDVFTAFAELAAAIAEEATLLALEATFVSDDFATSFKADTSRAEMAVSDTFVVAVDAEATADCRDAAAFVSDVFAVLALVAAALFGDSAAATLFVASRAFADAVPTLEDTDWVGDAAYPTGVLAARAGGMY